MNVPSRISARIVRLPSMTAAAWRWKPSATSKRSSILIDRDRRQPIPGVGISLDREIVEAVAEVEVRVEDEVVERYLANIHGGDSVCCQRERADRRCFNPTLSAYDRQRITAACVKFSRSANQGTGVGDHADCRDGRERPARSIPDRRPEGWAP